MIHSSTTSLLELLSKQHFALALVVQSHKVKLEWALLSLSAHERPGKQLDDMLERKKVVVNLLLLFFLLLAGNWRTRIWKFEEEIIISRAKLPILALNYYFSSMEAKKVFLCVVFGLNSLVVLFI